MGNTTISYDGGNPTNWYNGSKTYTGLTWTNGRQLTSVTVGSKTATYAYDADGIRTQKTVDGVTHTYYTLNGKLMRESFPYNGSTFIMDFIYDESGKPFALSYSSNGGENFYVYYYGVNAQGDVEKIFGFTTNEETGEEEEYVFGYYTYDAWGNVTAHTRSGGTPSTTSIVYRNPIRYRGYVYDNETGFYYLQSRYYDPANHRFINADSYASTGQGIAGTNMFSYCRNNPVKRCDSLGFRDEETDIWSTEHDSQGLFILFHWLLGSGEDCEFVGGSWGAYMRNNEILSNYVIAIVYEQTDTLNNGESKAIDITTSAEIENGESIIGYQYLHGTNADAGVFHIVGTVGLDCCGNVLYNINCTWNDIIDPNYIYASDRKKASLANLFFSPKDYKISITWNMHNPAYAGGGGRIRTVATPQQK